MTSGFVFATANDLQSVESLIDQNVCGILIECVQGEGGVIPLDKQFVLGVEQLCKQNDLVFMVDEVQTGNGRTGSLYAYMDYGVSPDVVTTAKGLGGGLPIGACLMNERVQTLLSYGDHGSTYGGNPVCSAGALTVINRLDEQFLQSVKEKSQYLFSEISKIKGVESVSGKGLMVGIKTTRPAKEVIAECIENGVLCLSAKDKVRLLPALNIDFETLKKAIEVIKCACAK